MSFQAVDKIQNTVKETGVLYFLDHYDRTDLSRFITDILMSGFNV